jgi:predicted Zn-dependent protease
MAGIVAIVAALVAMKCTSTDGVADVDQREVDSTASTDEPAREPAAAPKLAGAPKPEPARELESTPKTEPKPAAIPVEELDAKITQATNLVHRQKFDDARFILDQVLAKIPNEARALALVAQIYLEKSELEDALKTANDCVAADAQQAFCWIIIATVEQNNQNLPRALEAYRKYVELEPLGLHVTSAKKQITRLESKLQD